MAPGHPDDDCPRPACHPERSEPKASGVEGSRARRMAPSARSLAAPFGARGEALAKRIVRARPAPPGDTRAKLCLRRQPTSQTVPPTTARRPDCASDDNQTPFWAAPCRQRHSLMPGLSPDAQFDAGSVAGCTVWPAVADRLDGRRQQEARLHRRRQLGPDLAPFVSPGRQSGQWAVAGASVWPADNGRLDGRRQLADRLDGRRHEGAVFACLLSPGVESGCRAVAGRRVWPAGAGGIDRRRQ